MTMTEARIEMAVQYIGKHERQIVEAHERLGIPLADCLCFAIRKAIADDQSSALEIADEPSGRK